MHLQLFKFQFYTFSSRAPLHRFNNRERKITKINEINITHFSTLTVVHRTFIVWRHREALTSIYSCLCVRVSSGRHVVCLFSIDLMRTIRSRSTYIVLRCRSHTRYLLMLARSRSYKLMYTSIYSGYVDPILTRFLISAGLFTNSILAWQLLSEAFYSVIVRSVTSYIQ